jgi:hypothetical protein
MLFPERKDVHSQSGTHDVSIGVGTSLRQAKLVERVAALRAWRRKKKRRRRIPS